MISSSTGDEGDFPLFPSDVLEEAGRASDGDPIPLITSNSIHSSSVLCERSSPVDSSCFNSFHTPVYLDDEEATPSLPPDFELHESSVSPGSLGVWTKRRLEVGEEFGPFEGGHRRQSWE
ncbi:MDS1 and EVI1 complex locus protein EVI1-A isoform X1, partial [Tachysurus ichikawai]